MAGIAGKADTTAVNILLMTALNNIPRGIMAAVINIQDKAVFLDKTFLFAIFQEVGQGILGTRQRSLLIIAGDDKNK